MRITAAAALAFSACLAWAQVPVIEIEAESYAEVTGGTVRVLDREAASGGKCVSYWEEPGVAVTVEFEVEQAGEYCLTLKYACNWEDTRRQIAVDGQVPPGLEDVLLPGTGGWDAFGAITVPGADGGRVRLALAAGKHTLTLTNVDSRGLAWDAAEVHHPDHMPADFPLSDAELQELARAFGLENVLFHERGPQDFAVGDVRVDFSRYVLAGWRVGDTLFKWWVGGPETTATWEDASVAGLTVRVFEWQTAFRFPAPDAVVLGSSALLVSDGRSVYYLHPFEPWNRPDTTGFHLFMPAPVVTWRGGRPWRVSPWATDLRHRQRWEGKSFLPFDGTTLSAVGELFATCENGYEQLWLLHKELVHRNIVLWAFKIGPAITPGDSIIGAEVVGDDMVIRSSRQMYPALAAFYEMPQFECRVKADGSMTLSADGEELTVPPPYRKPLLEDVQQ